MKIEFDYLNNNDECWLETQWHGCCCQCMHHLEVNKHCCYSPSEPGRCVCKDSLGFYVCILYHDLEYNRGANLSGKHGYCEEFKQRQYLPDDNNG